MPEVSKSFNPDDVDVSISEVIDGIYRISGFVERYGITFNQFLIQDENPTLIHTGPIGMYSKIEEKVKEVINLENWLMLHFYILKAMNGWHGVS
jgi:flavorubredoxin